MALPVVKVRRRSDPPKKAPRLGTPPSVVVKVAEKKRLMVFHLTENKGNVAHACGKAGISRMTHYRWTREDPDYAQAADDIAESVVDYMESLLIKTTIDDKDLRTMRWFLERRGKDRGYGKPSVVQAYDGDGNPIYTNGGGNVAVQNNINLSIRADVPGDALSRALQDLAAKNPALLAQIGGAASQRVGKVPAFGVLDVDAEGVGDGEDDDDDA